jgi:hypothetical protein
LPASLAHWPNSTWSTSTKEASGAENQAFAAFAGLNGPQAFGAFAGLNGSGLRAENQAFAAFAAAFAFFLYDRTFSSDPASFTSATDMNEPALP